MLGGDHDHRAEVRQARILKRRRFGAARNHEVDVHARGHAVRPDGAVKLSRERLLVHAEVEIERLRPLEQAVQVLGQKSEPAVVQAHTPSPSMNPGSNSETLA